MKTLPYLKTGLESILKRKLWERAAFIPNKKCKDDTKIYTLIHDSTNISSKLITKNVYNNENDLKIYKKQHNICHSKNGRKIYFPLFFRKIKGQIMNC